MKFNRSMTRVFLTLILVFSLSAFMGCTEAFNATPSSGDTSTTANMKSGAPAKTTALYYDFEDVMVPKELKVVQDRTVVISTPGYTSGILVLKGRVERSSLINFFINNMQKDNWNIVSQIKSPENSILVFNKTSKCAVISIKTDQFNTWVEIGVAPNMSSTTTVPAPQTNDGFTPAAQGFSQGTLVE